MNTWRPCEYKEEYIDKIYEYINQCEDTIEKVVKTEWDKSTSYEIRNKVNLPTIDWFSKYINVPRRTLYDWRDSHETFSHTLDEILKEQKIRLINHSVAGTYMAPIAKMLLNVNHNMKETKVVENTGKDWEPIKYEDLSKLTKKEKETLRQQLLHGKNNAEE